MKNKKDIKVQKNRELSILIYSNGLSFYVKEASEQWGDFIELDQNIKLVDALKRAFETNAVFSFAFKAVHIQLVQSEFAVVPISYYLPKESHIFFDANVSWDYETQKNGSLGKTFFLQAIPLSVYSFLHQYFKKPTITHPGFNFLEAILKHDKGSYSLAHKNFIHYAKVEEGEVVHYEMLRDKEKLNEVDCDFFIGQKPFNAKGKVLGFSQVLPPDQVALYS